jgi:PTS system fructose-specific IIC component
MKIVELFHPSCMTMDLQATNKWDAVAELANLLFQNGRLSSLQDYLTAVYEREKQVSTGVGMGIAIPHGKSPAVLVPSVAFGRSRSGINFDAIDGMPVYLVFLLAIPASFSDREYLQTLARLARLLVHESFQTKLLSSVSPVDVLKVIQESEEVELTRITC